MQAQVAAHSTAERRNVHGEDRLTETLPADDWQLAAWQIWDPIFIIIIKNFNLVAVI
jgi:hypothetical protein